MRSKTRAEKRKKRQRNWFVALLVIVAVTVGGYLYYTRYLTPAEEAETPALQTTTVRKGDIVITAMGSGNLMPVAEISLGFRTGGTLTELAVAVGDEVETGQRLARLDDAAARIQVAQAELNLEQAQSRLETTRADADNTATDRLTSARVNLAQAVEQLADAQEAYNVAWDPARDWELDIKRTATALENERVSAIRSLKKAQDDLQIARANYNLALDGLQGDLQAAEWERSKRS